MTKGEAALNYLEQLFDMEERVMKLFSRIQDKIDEVEEYYERLSTQGELDVRLPDEREQVSSRRFSNKIYRFKSGERSQEASQDEDDTLIDLSDAIIGFEDESDPPLPEGK